MDLALPREQAQTAATARSRSVSRGYRPRTRVMTFPPGMAPPVSGPRGCLLGVSLPSASDLAAAARTCRRSSGRPANGRRATRPPAVSPQVETNAARQIRPRLCRSKNASTRVAGDFDCADRANRCHAEHPPAEPRSAEDLRCPGINLSAPPEAAQSVGRKESGTHAARNPGQAEGFKQKK